MKKTSSPENSQPTHKSLAQKSERARCIAAELLNAALKREFRELQHQLYGVIEAGLLESAPQLHELAQMISRMTEEVELLIPKYFPMSSHGRARQFAEDCSFEEQIAAFRQEIFWGRGEPQEQRDSEEIIRRIHNVYVQVDMLVRQIDYASEDIPLDRNHAPFLPGNIYALAG